MFFRVQRKNRVRGAAPLHASMLVAAAAPLIRPSGTFSLKGRREERSVRPRLGLAEDDLVAVRIAELGGLEEVADGFGDRIEALKAQSPQFAR